MEKSVEKSQKCMRRPQISEGDFLFLFSFLSGSGTVALTGALTGTVTVALIGTVWKANDAYAF